MDFTKLDGLIPAVIQDDVSNEVLMVGFMNQEALDRTVATGFATFFSRTRGKLWTKGETSGNRLQVERSSSIATRTRCWCESRGSATATSATPASALLQPGLHVRSRQWPERGARAAERERAGVGPRER